MSKSLGAGLLATYQSEVITVCGCFKVVRTDGAQFFFTELPQDVVYNGDTYIASSGFYKTAISQSSGLNTNNLDLKGLLSADEITREDLLGGLFNGAYIEYFEIDYENPANGRNIIDVGYIGQVHIQEDLFITEFRSLTDLLSQNIGNKYTRYCRHILGDTNCGIVLDPPVWTASTVLAVGDWISPTAHNGYIYKVTTAGTTNDTEGEPTWNTTVGGTTTETDGVVYETVLAHTYPGTVTSITDARRNFTDSGLAQADQFFQYGVVTFLTGNNAGFAFPVKYFGTGQIILIHETPFDITVTDTFKISAGCNHILKMPDGTYTGDCKTKFNNVPRYGGEPELVGDNSIIAGSA